MALAILLVWVYWKQNLSGSWRDKQLFRLTFAFGWQGPFRNTWLKDSFLYTYRLLWKEKKLQTLLNLGLSQSISPDFWWIYWTLTPTFTTWTYFQDERPLRICSSNKWQGRKRSLSINTCFRSICLGVPGRWSIKRGSRRLPETLVANTILK